MTRIKLILVSLCLLLSIGCSQDRGRTDIIAAKVTRVASGQTVEVILEETSEIVKVRITGIDAPDLRQSPWGETAKDRLTELVTGLPIQLETETPQGRTSNGMVRDRYNRVNAHIWQDKILISQKLVQEGCVLANKGYPHLYSKLLIDAQEYARLMGYGIWNPTRPMGETPNQFRSTIR